MKVWNFLRKLGVWLALICWYLAVSTSDYHNLVLKEADTPIINPLIVAGFILLIPTIVHVVVKAMRESRK